MCFHSCQANKTKKDIHWAYVVNDIPFGFEAYKSDSIQIPDSIYLKFEEVMDSVYLHSTVTGLGSKEESYDKLFFAIPANPNRLIFVMYYIERPFYLIERFFFILYDLKSKRFSHTPIELDADCLLDGEVKFKPEHRIITLPIIRYNEENNVIIVKQRMHNGNVINTVEERWIEIDSDMNLSPLFLIETLAYIPFDESDVKIKRELDDNGILHVTLIDSMSNYISDIGKATLFKNQNNLFEWKDIQISDSNYIKVFLSCDLWN